MDLQANGRFSVAEALRGRHVLVTGVTGFLGKVWLAMLLERVPDVRRVTVLIRARERESARDRFDRIVASSPALRVLRKKLGPDLWTLVDERVRVVAGNCSAPLCGLDEATAEQVCADLDVVVHFAGLTDFMPDPADGLAANVQGAWHAADLAARSRGRRLVHVSTAFVAGNASHDVPEQLEVGMAPSGVEFDPGGELAALEALCTVYDSKRARTEAAMDRSLALGWPNLYTYTKGLAEHLLATREDVQVTIVRPSIVECARTYPFAGWNEGVNTSGPLVWLFSTSFRHFPSRARHRFDVVPVDSVARCTMAVTAAALRNVADPVYHVASSDTNPLTFGRAIDLTNLGVRRMHSRPEARWIDRWITRHLDVTAVDASARPWTGPANVSKAANKLRELLGKVRLERDLPPDLYERIGGTLQQRLSKMSRQCRKTERNMMVVDQMLRTYQPFIHDNDQLFRTDRARRLSDRLSAAERELFGFDIGEIDWRHYWLEVEVPGLEKWTLPVLRGERVPEDPALHRSQPAEEPDGAVEPAESPADAFEPATSSTAVGP